jgi:hypothetical protein
MLHAAAAACGLSGRQGPGPALALQAQPTCLSAARKSALEMGRGAAGGTHGVPAAEASALSSRSRSRYSLRSVCVWGGGGG